MGISKRTHNLSQFKTNTNLPSDFLSTITDKIRYYSFREIDPDSSDEISYGWVDYQNILDNEFETMSFLKEPYIVLGFRIDKRSVPSTTLKRCCLQEENRIKKRSQKIR